MFRKTREAKADRPDNRNRQIWGAGVAQWVKASAFSSGYDPRVLGSSPALGSLLSWEPAPCPTPALCLPLCLLVISVYQINKIFKKYIKKIKVKDEK